MQRTPHNWAPLSPYAIGGGCGLELIFLMELLPLTWGEAGWVAAGWVGGGLAAEGCAWGGGRWGGDEGCVWV